MREDQQSLYTVAEAARILGMSASTLSGWTRRYRPHILVTRRLDAKPGYPSIPFIGIAECLVLKVLRRDAKVPMQRILPAVRELSKMGINNALASNRLYTDGAEVLYNHAQDLTSPARELAVVRNGQCVINDTIKDYLKALIVYGTDGYPTLINPPRWRRAGVVLNPGVSFGSPIFREGGARVSAVLDWVRAGEDLQVVSEEFGVPVSHIKEARSLECVAVV